MINTDSLYYTPLGQINQPKKTKNTAGYPSPYLFCVTVSYDLDISYTVLNDHIDKLVSRMVAFGGYSVEHRQQLVSDADGNDLRAVLAAAFDLQRFVLHCTHLAYLAKSVPDMRVHT